MPSRRGMARHKEMWACFNVPFSCCTRQPETAPTLSARWFAATSKETSVDLNLPKTFEANFSSPVSLHGGHPAMEAKVSSPLAYVGLQPCALVFAHKPIECGHPKRHILIDPAPQQPLAQARYSAQPCPTTMGECHPKRDHGSGNGETLGLGTHSMYNGPHMYQRGPSFGCTPHGPSWFAWNSEDLAKPPSKPALVAQKGVHRP